MLVAKLSDQLGNQMFSYASVKSISLDKGLQFFYYKDSLAEKYVNDVDKNYGRSVDTIFEIPSEERFDGNVEELIQYNERPMKERFDEEYIGHTISRVEDNMFMKGHFISTKYFAHRMDEVRKWFVFPEAVQDRAREKLRKISLDGKRAVVSVHFRVGKDYMYRGNALHHSYWGGRPDIYKLKWTILYFCAFMTKRQELSKNSWKNFMLWIVAEAL